jgi:hypothetical protein
MQAKALPARCPDSRRNAAHQASFKSIADISDHEWEHTFKVVSAGVRIQGDLRLQRTLATSVCKREVAADRAIKA